MIDLQIEDVQKRRGITPVLSDMNLAVPHGRVVALLGPSGCGKTTLLRLVAGFDRCDGGRISMGGATMDGDGLFVPSEKRGIGYVPQEGLLFPHLTVAGNVGFGLTRAARRAGGVADALRLAGLDGIPGIAERSPHQLSGGQQQRVALARALATRPRLILLDEPFNGLDGALRRSVAAEVSTVLREAGTTALLVTHDPSEAFACADDIAVFGAGRIVQYADPVTLYQRPATIDIARLTGPTLVLDAMVRAGHAETPLGLLAIVPSDMPDGPARVVLRPEQVRLADSGVGVDVRARVFAGDHTQVSVAAGPCRLDLRVPGFVPQTSTLHVAVTGEGLAFPR